MKRRNRCMVMVLSLAFVLFLGMPYLSAPVVLSHAKSLKTPSKVQAGKGTAISLPMPAGCSDMNINVPAKLTITIAE